jgi:hypothetical protein
VPELVAAGDAHARQHQRDGATSTAARASTPMTMTTAANTCPKPDMASGAGAVGSE